MTLHSLQRISKGFSLIELVTTVVLIGVLAVVAGTRIQTRQGFTEYAFQDRLITALRNMQLRAMQDTRPGYCFQLNFSYSTTSAFGPPSVDYTPGNSTATCATGISSSAPDYLAIQNSAFVDDGITLSSSDGSINNFSYLGFDALGRPLNDAANCGTGTACEIAISGESSVKVCIESEGYIHGC